jgi:hypothetical protein
VAIFLPQNELPIDWCQTWQRFAMATPDSSIALAAPILDSSSAADWRS